MRLFLLILPFCPYLLFSQGKDSIQTYSSVVVNSYLGGASMPFWLRANQYGTAPSSTPALSVQAQSLKCFQLKNKNWKIGYGVEIVGNIAKQSQLLLPQVYLQVNLKSWELYVGRRRETFGLSDTTLGTGAYSWAGNALPIPKIQLSIPNYKYVRFTKNWVAVKGTFSHGWFGNETFVNHYFLHQKSLFIRISKPNSKFKFYGGFVHNVQWGGMPTYNADTNLVNKDGKFPHDFRDYLYVVGGSGGGVTGPLPGNIGLNQFDQGNRIGNHLGTIDMGFDYDFEKYTFSFYRQNVFEDGSLYYGTNIQDGLNGITLKKRNFEPNRGKFSVSKFNAEFLYTMSQGGDIFGSTKYSLGKDNYFNHAQFRDGWWYRGHVIGSPFLTNRFDSRAEFQEVGMYNGYENINNNRVRVYHIAMEGYYGTDIHFRTKLSLSHNYGTYDFGYGGVKQLSGLVEADGKTKWLGGLQWTAAAGFDVGQLYNNSFALRLGLRYNGR